MRLTVNQAGVVDTGVGRGGAIALDGSRLTASQISITGNSAHPGGGVSVVNGSTALIQPTGHLDPDARGRLKDCWSTRRCNGLSDNRAGADSSSGSGGALFVDDSDAC